MTYSISKAISLVNKEIDKRSAGNEDYYFPADFYGESSTENFVRLCVKSNHLDRVLIDQWSDGQQYIYIHNILHFWYGMHPEEADEFLKMCNACLLRSCSLSRKTVLPSISMLRNLTERR